MPFTLKAELHCHSNDADKRLPYFPLFYDSVQSSADIINRCSNLGINILAITDHDSLDGYFNAKKYIQSHRLPLLLIPACEISSADGHILAYGITTPIPMRLSAKKVIDLVHQQGGLAFAAHPFMLRSLHRHVFDLNLDGVEVFNSSVPKMANLLAAKATLKLNLPGIAGSDAHNIFDIGASTTLFSSNVSTVGQFLSHLKSGRFQISPHTTSFPVSFLRHVSAHFKGISLLP
jgi:predicted metal-dependent phosphoesterase TrpH